jgi:hypothetical protein
VSRKLGVLVAVLVVAMLAIVPVAAALTDDVTDVTSFSPSSAEMGTTVTITIYGVSLWNIGGDLPQAWLSYPDGLYSVSDGYNLQTLGDSGGQLRATFSLYGLSPGTYDVNVTTSWGGTGWKPGFQITNPQPVGPSLYGISPQSITAGTGAFALQVSGSNFVTGPSSLQSQVQWNGQSLTTTASSTGRLTAIVPGNLILSAGTAQVRVMNPSGLGSPTYSNATSISITAPAPTVTSISPTQAWAGSIQATTLTVNGTNFLSGAQILLNGVARSSTSFLSSSQLSYALTSADISYAQSITVSVQNPGGSASMSNATLTVAAETTTPTVTISGADSAWHNQPVSLSIVASDSQSGLQKVQFQVLPSVPSWTTGSSVTVLAPASHANDGTTTVNAQAFDWCNNMGSATAQVNIDTTQPETSALAAVTVTRGKNAKLQYMATEPANLSPTAVVVIKVKSQATGQSVKTFNLGTQPMNQALSTTFKCNLAKGNYRYYVYATDLAGNQQRVAASNMLKVK